MAFRHDLFLGLQPKGSARDRIALHQAVRAAAGQGEPRLVPADCLHMTLHPIGSFPNLPRQIVDAAIGAAATIAMPSFDIALNRIACWSGGKGQRTLVLTGDEGVIGADRLYEKVRDALGKARLLPGRYGFNPHVTLMRGASVSSDEFVEAIRWRVSEFVLIHSLVGEGRHEVLGRWPLHPAR